jgi:hypothetical protein
MGMSVHIALYFYYLSKKNINIPQQELLLCKNLIYVKYLKAELSHRMFLYLGFSRTRSKVTRQGGKMKSHHFYL